MKPSHSPLNQYLKNLSRRNKKLKARRLQQKWDNAYQNDPVSVYKLLTESLDRQKNQYIPRLSQDEKNFEQLTGQQREQTYFKNVEEVDSYWRDLWETEAKENVDADWIKEIEDSMGQTGGGDHTKS